MRTKTIITLLGCAALLLVSCDVKDPIYNTPHPDKGSITGTTEWTERGEGVVIPAQYRVEASGTTTTADETTFTLPGLFEPGDVEVLAYNLPAGVSINNGIATMNAVANGTSGTLLVPDAGVLFSGTTTAHVVADDVARVTLAMQQRMRQVRFTLTITDGDPERITTVKARLNGVAGSVNLRMGEVTGDATAITLPFVRKGDKLTAEIWTMGIATGAKQLIVTTLSFSDGNQAKTTADVTDTFRDFNADKLTPLNITGSLYAPIGAELDGSIIDWTAGNGDGSDMDANI